MFVILPFNHNSVIDLDADQNEYKGSITAWPYRVLKVSKTALKGFCSYDIRVMK